MFFRKKIVNEVFGKLVYDCNWHRNVTYELWGKTHNLCLQVESSNEEHEIQEIQEQAYKVLLSKISQLEERVKAYFLDNYYEVIEEYYIDYSISWASTPSQRQQLENIIYSYEQEGKNAINDMLSNIILSTITVEASGRIVLLLYVNIPDSHGLLVVIESEIKIFTLEEYEEWCK